MLDYWMNNAVDPLPSWEVLVDALKAPTVGESRLAKELEEKYCNLEDQSSLGELGAIYICLSQYAGDGVLVTCVLLLQIFRAG